ncbi:hypothetical protein B0H65DRAFT_166083 [Neurospora tetraspora]|uniref:Uncharacterized protein n=1 Tax=Neurospora tetraspora TaxID=94610 RepID=A0AAE0JHV9_9PEZI|nr:hypothetical protein B0H65DRAFT_166083 [Neurospora tetraspora]
MPRTMMAIKGSSLGFHDPASGNPLQIRCLPPTVTASTSTSRPRGSSSDSSNFRGSTAVTTVGPGCFHTFSLSTDR